MRFVSGWFIVLIVSICYLNIEGRTFPVSNYGAQPNDNIDDTNGIQSAINAAISNGPNNIVLLESGTYNCSAGFSIYGATNLTVMGQGMQRTLLLFNSSVGAFWIQNCQTIMISSLAIDFDPLPFTAGYVVNVTTNYLDVEIVPPHRADIGQQVAAILRYDPTLMRPAIGSSAYEIYQTPPSGTSTTLVSSGILNIPLAAWTAFNVGDAIVARYSFTNHAIDAQDVTNFTLQSITIYTSWEMGAVTLRAKGINMIDYHVKPGEGRWMSTVEDCMHFSDSRNYINIFDSSCEAQGDDGLNVQAFYFQVTQVINSTALTIQEYSWPDVLNVGVGTHLEFSSSQQPFTVYGTTTVVSSSVNGGNTQLFIFASPINASVGDWVCVADTPLLTIRNLTVANNRARGVLLETRNIDITQSLFNQTSGPAVLFQPSLYWYEGPAARNVSLSQNVYINCNEGLAQQNGVIAFLPDPVQLVPVVYNVQITSSTFLNGQYSQHPIQCTNGGGVSISNNYFATNSSGSIVILCNSQNISAYNNAVVNNQSTISQYFSYDSTHPCLTNLSNLINLPNSSFNSSFPPPVIATSSGVQVNNHQTDSFSSNKAARITAVHLFIWDANIFDSLQCETFFILLPCWMLLRQLHLAIY
jgi:hypothetical protein